MTKNRQFLQFQCNQSPVRDRGLFLAKGYRGYREIHNFPQWILLHPILPFFILLSAKSLYFCVFSVTLIAQPKPRQGYTGIFFSVTERQKIGAILSLVRVTLELRLSVTHY